MKENLPKLNTLESANTFLPYPDHPTLQILLLTEREIDLYSEVNRFLPS